MNKHLRGERVNNHLDDRVSHRSDNDEDDLGWGRPGGGAKSGGSVAGVRVRVRRM